MTAELHVLIVPNMTFSSGGRWRHESDSFVADLRALLPRLIAARPALRFTLLTPEYVPSLARWADMIEWPLPTYNNAMRCHFDVPRFLRAVAAKRRSFDIVWSHLPEQTLAVKNVIYNSTDERPAFIGYSHWCEIPELNTFSATTFGAWLAGAHECLTVGVTTAAMKDTIVARAAEYVSPARLAVLDAIVQPMYLGTDAPAEYRRYDPEPGLLLWNHRLNTYTGWPLVLDQLDQLWQRRTDFRVITTLADSSNRPYMMPSGLLPSGAAGYRAAYFGLLTRGWLGLPRLSSHWTWPVAIADGMSAGLPYVVPSDFYVGEVFPPDYPLAYDGGRTGAAGLADALSAALDDPGVRHRASEMSRAAALVTSWDERITPFVEQFDRAVQWIRPVGDSAGYRRLAELVRARPKITKAEILSAMDWHGSFPFTPYRRRLALDGASMTADRYWFAD